MADIIEKIKKLLALAERGGTEAEAALAAEMAASLALKHNIDLAAVQTGPMPRNYNDVQIAIADKFEQWMANIVGGVAHLHGCKHYFSSRHDKSVAWNVIGRPNTAEAIKLTVEYLVEATKRFNRQAVMGRGLDKVGRQAFRESFRLACSQRLRVRLREKYDAMTTTDVVAQTSVGSTALVVSNYFEQERKEIALWMEEKGYKLTNKTHNVRDRSDEGRAAGLSAGNRIGLDAQVKSGGDNRRITSG